MQALKNGICDFLLAFEDPTLTSEQFRKLDLQTEELIPVCRADEEGKPLFDLDDPIQTVLPYLGYPKEIYLGRCVERLLCRLPRSVELQQASESPLADSLKVMAMQGMGVAWVPSFAIHEELKQGFVVPCGGGSLSQGAEELWQILNARYSAAPPLFTTDGGEG